jgi:hypothetical protein
MIPLTAVGSSLVSALASNVVELVMVETLSVMEALRRLKAVVSQSDGGEP